MSLRVSLCVSVRTGAASVLFRPNILIGLMQFGSGGKRTVGAAATVGRFRPHPSTCFIWLGGKRAVDVAAGEICRPNVLISLEQFGLEQVRRQCSCR